MRHPIFDSSGQKAGALVKGVRDIGYTYCCIYSDMGGCFFVTHVPFSAVMGGGPRVSRLSVIDSTGDFELTGQGKKFRLMSSIDLPVDWVGSEIAFYQRNNGRQIFLLTRQGFVLVNTLNRSLIQRVDFEAILSEDSFDMSPKVGILAAAFTVFDRRDPLEGHEIYQHSLCLIDIESGKTLGSHPLPGNEYSHWDVIFDPSGREISVHGKTDAIRFALSAD